jgi:hypothetical protein
VETPDSADEPRPIEAHSAGRKAHFLTELAQFGPRLTTTVRVNGRWMSLDAVMNLIEQLPASVSLTRLGRSIEIDPSPFDATVRGEPRTSDSAALVRTLLERQDATDHLTEHERYGERWWRRMLKRLKVLS